MTEVQQKRTELEKLYTLKQLRAIDEKYGMKPSLIKETTEWSVLLPVKFPEGRTTSMVYYDKMPEVSPGSWENREKFNRWYDDIRAIGFMKVLNLMGTKFIGSIPIVVIQLVSAYNTFAKFSKEAV